MSQKRTYSLFAIGVLLFTLLKPDAAAGQPSDKQTDSGTGRHAAGQTQTKAPHPSEPAPDEETLRTQILEQRWGIGLLGAGAGVSIVGIILTQVDPWGDVGDPGLGHVGLTSIGVGLALMTAGMFVLGFSRPVHLREPKQSIAVVPAVGGGALTYRRTF